MPGVTVVIKNGKITIDMQGYRDNSCIQDANKIIELIKKFDVEVSDRNDKLKPEAQIPSTEQGFVRT